jgi:type VI secretion system protein ImpK
MPLFKSLRLLQSHQASELSLDFAESLHRSLLSLEHLGLEKQIASHHVSDAKYALAALIDESIMRSEWPGKTLWMDQSLQLRLFGEHLAGVNFFNRLARIRQSGELNIAVLEIFFVCLQLGFQGKYAMSQQEELKALQVDIKHQLDLYQGGFNASLSYDLDNLSDSHIEAKHKVPNVAWIGGFVVAMGLLYGGYGFLFQKLYQDHNVLVDQAIADVSGM